MSEKRQRQQERHEGQLPPILRTTLLGNRAPITFSFLDTYDCLALFAADRFLNTVVKTDINIHANAAASQYQSFLHSLLQWSKSSEKCRICRCHCNGCFFTGSFLCCYNTWSKITVGNGAEFQHQSMPIKHPPVSELAKAVSHMDIVSVFDLRKSMAVPDFKKQRLLLREKVTLLLFTLQKNEVDPTSLDWTEEWLVCYWKLLMLEKPSLFLPSTLIIGKMTPFYRRMIPGQHLKALVMTIHSAFVNSVFSLIRAHGELAVTSTHKQSLQVIVDNNSCSLIHSVWISETTPLAVTQPADFGQLCRTAAKHPKLTALMFKDAENSLFAAPHTDFIDALTECFDRCLFLRFIGLPLSAPAGDVLRRFISRPARSQTTIDLRWDCERDQSLSAVDMRHFLSNCKSISRINWQVIRGYTPEDIRLLAATVRIATVHLGFAWFVLKQDVSSLVTSGEQASAIYQLCESIDLRISQNRLYRQFQSKFHQFNNDFDVSIETHDGFDEGFNGKKSTLQESKKESDKSEEDGDKSEDESGEDESEEDESGEDESEDGDESEDKESEDKESEDEEKEDDRSSTSGFGCW